MTQSQHQRERFLRNLGIMDEKGLKKIQSTPIAIGGLGLGGSIFINLVRLGFKHFHVADPDIYERTNFNRQRLAKESTTGLRKDDCLIKEALDINPEITVRAFKEGVSPSNVNEFLKGMKWVVDVIDVYAMEAKLALNARARELHLPVASCGSLGFSGSVVIFDPTSPSFAELSGVSLERSSLENVQNFLQFIAPEIPPYMADQLFRAMDHSTHIPFVVPGVETAAATAAAQIAGQVLGLSPEIRAPQGIFMDPLTGTAQIFEASFKVRKFRAPSQKKAA